MPNVIPIQSGISFPRFDSAGPSLLTAGSYYADGSVSLAPNSGNYTATTSFDDGSAGDTTTRVTSSGASQTEVIVLPSAISLSEWAQTKKYKGNLTGVAQIFAYWASGAWQTLTDTQITPWSPHLGYTDESRTATFSGVPSASIFRCVTTESDTSLGNMSTSDSRPA